ncbi:hypothetical protein [Microbulbifer sp. SSSA008]|uniref:hypothetical protein n=1 Tax=unclassified Microbulbifer TaxID=2619833 RepID=UPI0040394E2D
MISQKTNLAFVFNQVALNHTIIAIVSTRARSSATDHVYLEAGDGVITSANEALCKSALDPGGIDVDCDTDHREPKSTEGFLGIELGDGKIASAR